MALSLLCGAGNRPGLISRLGGHHAVGGLRQVPKQVAGAAQITGVPADKIVQAAEMLAKPVNGQRPKASFALEKGNYWSNNYGNTASFAALSLLCGAGNP